MMMPTDSCTAGKMLTACNLSTKSKVKNSELSLLIILGCTTVAQQITITVIHSFVCKKHILLVKTVKYIF